MSNTISSALIHEITIEEGMTSLGPVLASVKNFEYKVELNPIAPGGTVNVSIVTGGSSATKNPASYEAGDTTVENRPVVVDEYSSGFHVTQAEANNGRSLKNFARKHLQLLAQKAQDVIFSPMTSANFGPPEVDVTSAAFDPDTDLQDVWEAGANFPQKNLILAGGYYKKLLPTSNDSINLNERGARGFDSISPNTRWDGAQTGVVGFLGAADSLAIATGEPAVDDEVKNSLLTWERIPLNDDMDVYYALWVNTATRKRWASFGLMLGAQVGDKEAGVLIGDGVAGGIDPTDTQDAGEPTV